MSPELVFRYLTERGARIEGEYLIIAEWLVQFLPPTGPLVEEALEAAVEVEVEEISTRVFTAEHLAAIALQTGPPNRPSKRQSATVTIYRVGRAVFGVIPEHS